MQTPYEVGAGTGAQKVQEHEPVWQTKVPFGIEPGDGTLIAKAMRAYRPETSEEETLIDFFVHEFEKLDAKQE